MTYRVRLTNRAWRELEACPARARVARAIDGLQREPRPPGCQKLVGADAFRVRVGDYRILYEIDDEAALVLIVTIGHRREVYR